MQRVDDLLEYLEVERGYSEHTIAAYRNDMGQFLGYLEGLEPAGEAPTRMGQCHT